jgi:hypothetical protein
MSEYRKLPRQAIVFSLGDAARFAVQYMRERRPNVRIRLPDGEILGFEAFQQAVFDGKLTDRPGARNLQSTFRPNRPLGIFAGETASAL